jgi:hypothetical protein
LPRPPRLLVVVVLVVGSVCRVAGAAEDAAPYVQEHGPARLTVEGGTVRDGKVEVPLSGTLRVVFTVRGGAGLEVEPVKALTTAEGWAVRTSAAPQQTSANGRVSWRQEFVLEPAKPGELPLPLAPLRYRETAGPWRTVAWDAAPVQVTTEVATADLKQLHDVRGPIQLPEPPPWPRWPLGVALAVLLAGVAVGVWRLRRRTLPETPPLPPHEWALRELDRLETLNLPEQGEIDRYHTLLSDILRRFLELRFQLHAPRQTTAEFLQAAETSRQLAPAQQELLREFMQRCDLAKFARALASAEECRAAAELARSFISQTATQSPQTDSANIEHRTSNIEHRTSNAQP